MTPREIGAGREAGPLSVPAPLGFRHPDGQPLTPEDCRAAYRAVCEENRLRAAAMKRLEGTTDPAQAREYAALCLEARIGNARAQVWGGLDGLARLAQEAGEA